jgi:hypothetical protein
MLSGLIDGQDLSTIAEDSCVAWRALVHSWKNVGSGPHGRDTSAAMLTLYKQLGYASKS